MWAHRRRALSYFSHPAQAVLHAAPPTCVTATAAGSRDWHAVLSRDPSDLSEDEWLVIARGLQTRATSFIRDTWFADVRDVRVHATPVGRGRYDVIARYPDPGRPQRMTTEFLTAAYDPVRDRWSVSTAGSSAP